VELSSTNLILFKGNIFHFIELSYRPKAFLTQTIENNNPTYQISLFLINLTGSITFTGSTPLKLTYLGAEFSEINFIEDDTNTTLDRFELHIEVDGVQGTYAVININPLDGLTISYKLTTVVYNFEISK